MKIAESLSDVRIGFSSLVYNFYHLGVLKVAHWSGYINKTYHEECAQYHGSKGWNALYRLVGSHRRICFFAPSQWLVKTKNRMAPELENNSSRQRITDRAQNLFQNHPLPYIKTHLNRPVELENGICQGMVTHFIHDFQKERNQGIPFQEAAIKAAKAFEEGAPLLACALEHIHLASEIDADEFDRAFPKWRFSENQREIIYFQARSFCGDLILGAKKVFCSGLNVFRCKLESLPNGSYDINLGRKVVSDRDGDETFSRNDTHATALLIENQSYLIFDPNLGLIKHPEPSLYFETSDSTFEGEGRRVLHYHSVEYQDLLNT